MRTSAVLVLTSLTLLACKGQEKPQAYDMVIRHGRIYDGTGKPPYDADLAINADTIAAIGDLSQANGKKEIDATGLAIAPGFINMLSWSDGVFLQDGRSLSDIKQGVTLEVFGEGLSAGPKKDSTAKEPWRSLGQFFDLLQRKGVSPNFASFVGATTVRKYVLGDDDRKPSPAELATMKSLVQQAMNDGAMGVGSSLIYAPADFASTEELTELCKVASAAGGMYITHMRSEGDRIYQALNETFRIAHDASIAAEIYHLKISQKWNWNKIDTVLAKIDSAQHAGLRITANMYPYIASGTSLVARLPTWVQAGGPASMRKRLRTPSIRKKVLEELALGIPSRNSDPADVLILGFRTDSLNRLYKNKRLNEIAKLHRKDADNTMIDLILADKSSIPSTIYFLMSEDNVKRMLRLPFVSVCSDAASRAAEKPFTDDGTHPRVYGSFARFLGKYVRDEKLMTIEEGVRRMTSLPASNLKLRRRGELKPSYFADVVVFDAQRIIDHSTFEDPHHYATGVVGVLVNGVLVLKDGEHTGATPGRCLRGPGSAKK